MGRKRWWEKGLWQEEGTALLRLGAVDPGGLDSYFARVGKSGVVALPLGPLGLSPEAKDSCWLGPS